MLEILLAIYGVVIVIMGLAMAVSEPLEDDDSMWNTIVTIPEAYVEISRDLKNVVLPLRGPLVVFVIFNIFLMYLVSWSVQFRFLYTKGWK
jgi:hypothetical protein